MATITVRMEEWTKSNLYRIADELWISVPSMFNAFAKDIIRNKRVSFSLSDDYVEDQEMYQNATRLQQKWQESLQSGRSSLVI